MTRLICLVCLLVAMTSACVISAPVSPPKPTMTTEIATLAPEKPAKASNIYFMPYDTTVTADLLNIRTAPSHASPIIPHVWLIEGEQVTVIECRGVWGRIGAGRWVNTIYLSKGCE